MATTAALVAVGPNKLRYLITYTGAGGTSVDITSTGAATPDLLTDSVQGPIKKLAKVITDGFGLFAAGAQTQAKARALWLSDWAGAAPGLASPIPPLTTTARCRLVPRTSVASLIWTVDANVSGGNPILTVSMASLAGTAGTVYLDVEVPEAIG